MQILPDKSSELIMLALSDLAKVQNDPKYTVHMGYWHSPTYEGVCIVCLAGSVMAKTLDADPHRGAEPECFRSKDNHNHINLMRLDQLRRGYDKVTKMKVDITSYAASPEQFFRDMTDFANQLALKGN